MHSCKQRFPLNRVALNQVSLFLDFYIHNIHTHFISTHVYISMYALQHVPEKEEGDEGSSLVVTNEQPRSPQKREQREVAEQSALEAAEQQMHLIHEEYKKLLREKQVKCTM